MILFLTLLSLSAAAGIREAQARQAQAREAQAAAASKGGAKGYRARLAAECDELVRFAVKTPFGWGWAEGGAGGAPRGRESRLPAGRVATIDTRATAAAGLMLHESGVRLNEPRYKAAAFQAGRALAAVQTRAGQVPAAGVLAGNAGGKDELAAVPAREATNAALGLLLTLIDDETKAGKPPNEQVKRAASKAAYWLTTQQTKAGAWPVAYPSDAQPKDATKLIRLDEPGYRDSTYALLLAGRVLNDPKLRRFSDMAVAELVVMRISEDDAAGFNLWSSAYVLDGTPATRFEELQYAIDVPATRHAMQTLLAACLLGDAAAAPVLQEADKALSALPQRDGKWDRYYDIYLRKSTAVAERNATPDSDVFKSGDEAGESGDADSGASSDFGLNEVLAAARRVRTHGAEKCRAAMAGLLPVEHRLAQAACGLGEAILETQLPAEPGEVADYVRRHDALWRTIDAPPPPGVWSRVERLRVLLLRVQLEEMQKQAPQPAPRPAA